MLEASVLVMEAFENQEVKFIYDITGHSGDGYNIPFVEVGKAPKNNKERLEVIKVPKLIVVIEFTINFFTASCILESFFYQ